jgi:hypothetical protein
VDVGTVELVMTDLLLQKTFAVPSRGMPRIRSLAHLVDSIRSTAILIATNSDPNVDDSTVL